MKKFNKNSIIMTLTVFSMLGLVGPVLTLAASPATVNLGTSGNFVILTKTGISTTGVTSINGDIGVSPAEATYITGFGLILPAGSAFSTSALVNGKVYAPSYANPTPANLTTAVRDMQTAYTDAAGRAPDVTELSAGNIGGLTLTSGVYKWGTGLAIPTDVTLSGGANDVWIFQVAQNLNLSPGKKIVLAGGAKANNIFWVVAGQTTIGTTAVFNGNILDQTAIVLNTGAVLNGRALAQTAVTLDANAVTIAIYPEASTPTVPIIPIVSTINVSCHGTPSATGDNGVLWEALAPVGIESVIPYTYFWSGTDSLAGGAQKIYNTYSTFGTKNAAVNVTSGNQVGTASCSADVIPVDIIYAPIVPASPSSNSSNNTTSTTIGGINVNQFRNAYNTALQNQNKVTSSNASNFGQQVKTIAINLEQGVRGNDVQTLQQFLISQDKGSASQALTTASATGYFGVLTRAALAEFQSKVGINPPLGNFGPITREYLNVNY